MSEWNWGLTLCLLGLFYAPVAQAQEEWGSQVRSYFQQKGIEESVDTLLLVSLRHQCMYLIVNDTVVEEYHISGSALGAGNRSGSNQTPLGLHRVKERHGDGVPLGGILQSRQYIGKVATIFTDPIDVEEDHVTTRVLWLEGLETGVNRGGNVDSYNRYIYIHGTPEEGLIGRPASHGCIRMYNREVLALYDQTPVGRLVLILP